MRNEERMTNVRRGKGHREERGIQEGGRKRETKPKELRRRKEDRGSEGEGEREGGRPGGTTGHRRRP